MNKQERISKAIKDVVSEMMDKLSPNIAPPKRDALNMAKEASVVSAKPITTAPKATIAPTEVPVEMAKKAVIINTPAYNQCIEIYSNPKFTIASTLPVALQTIVKAPANK